MTWRGGLSLAVYCSAPVSLAQSGRVNSYLIYHVILTNLMPFVYPYSPYSRATCVPLVQNMRYLPTLLSWRWENSPEAQRRIVVVSLYKIDHTSILQEGKILVAACTATLLTTSSYKLSVKIPKL